MSNDTKTTPILYTVPQYAAIWQVSQGTIWNWIRKGKLQVEQIEHTVRILGRKPTAEESGNAEAK